MKIDQLKMTNFKCFAERELELRSRFNLLVGDNGTGKTAILDALAGGIEAYLRFVGGPYKMVRELDLSNVRQEFYLHGQTLTLEPQFPISLEISGEFVGRAGHWNRRYHPGNPQQTGLQWLQHNVDELRQQVQGGEPVMLPMIGYYGTQRLWIQQRQKVATTLGPDSRFAGYQECLNPASNQKQLVEWFKTQEFAALQQRREIAVLEACRAAILACVPDSTHVYFDVSHDQIVLVIQGKATPFNLLSDGYRNVLAMVADIAVRCATLNPQLEREAPRETPGVVLIDELDLHLHPKWQRRVIDDLLRAFPKIQFVATTHSPFVIQSLPDHEDVQLINLDDEENRDVYDKSIEEIAEWVQGVESPQRSQRYLEMMETAERYFKLLKEDSGATPTEKQAVRDELEKAMGPFSDNPAYLAFVRMQELAAKGENGQKDAGNGARAEDAS